MTYLLFSLLFLATVIFYILEIAFKSFSRIALAGYLEDLQQEKTIAFDYVKNHERLLYALRGFSFFLQLGLFLYTYHLLGIYVSTAVYRGLLLVVSFLLLFNCLLYTLAFLKREALLKRLLGLTRVAWVFFYPVNMVFSFFARKVPEEKESDQDDLSEKELEVFIEEGAREGVLESEDKEMIFSILEFGDTLVKEIMTPRVDMVYVDLQAGLEELVTKINDAKKSRYPVISGRIDNIEGVILAKDVFDYWKNHKGQFSTSRILRPAFFVPETMRILELLKEMQKSKQKFAVVVDEFGGISGMVTMEDIIEEIVGEIHDEYDEETEHIVREKDHFLVRGDTDICQVNSTLKTNLQEDEDYQTVAGLISFKLGKIPSMGERVTVEGNTFEVVEMEKNRTKKVRVYTKTHPAKINAVTGKVNDKNDKNDKNDRSDKENKKNKKLKK